MVDFKTSLVIVILSLTILSCYGNINGNGGSVFNQQKSGYNEQESDLGERSVSASNRENESELYKKNIAQESESGRKEKEEAKVSSEANESSASKQAANSDHAAHKGKTEFESSNLASEVNNEFNKFGNLADYFKIKDLLSLFYKRDGINSLYKDCSSNTLRVKKDWDKCNEDSFTKNADQGKKDKYEDGFYSVFDICEDFSEDNNVEKYNAGDKSFKEDFNLLSDFFQGFKDQKAEAEKAIAHQQTAKSKASKANEETAESKDVSAVNAQNEYSSNSADTNKYNREELSSGNEFEAERQNINNNYNQGSSNNYNQASNSYK